MGQKTDNKVMKQMQNLWNQKPNNRQHLSNDEINDMLSSDERVDKLYNMMKGKINEIGDTENGMYAIGQVAGRAYDRMLNSPRNKNMKKNVIKLNENTLRQIVAESVRKVVEEDYYEDWKKKYEKKQRKGFSPKDADRTVKMMAAIAKNKENNPYLNENYNQSIVDDAIQAILSIREKVSKAATQVGFNPEQGDAEVSKLIKQISTLMYRLDRTVNVDYYDSFYSGQD